MPLVELHHSIHAPGSPCSLFQIEHNLLIIIAESPQNRNEGSPHPANAGLAWPDRGASRDVRRQPILSAAEQETRWKKTKMFPVLSSFGSRSDLSLRQRRNDGSGISMPASP
jgi:hypothetical protein